MRLDRVIKLEKHFADCVVNIYRNAARYHWEHSQINGYLKTWIYENEDYRRMPRYAHSFVEGVLWLLERDHWKLVEYSYEIKGERLTLTDPKYRKVSAEYVHKHCSQTGCYVYKDDKTKFFTLPPGA